MSGLPGFLLRHTVTVEAYEGASAYGPQYAAAEAVRCFLDEGTRTVKAADGTDVVSSGTLYAPLDTACPPESRVTLPDGRTSVVIAALRRDGGGLPTPDHLEVQLT
ncbi:hypothetical protein ACWGRF_02090 [Streptomyces zhihengii]